MTKEEMNAEIQKCKASPYYYATTYLQINGKPFTTYLTEEEFNSQFKFMGEVNGARNRHIYQLKPRRLP